MLIIYILFIYTFFYLISLYFIGRAYKKYNPEKLSISRLGTKVSPYHKLFNALGLINGTLLVLVGIGLNWHLVEILGACLIVVALVPWDRSKFVHDGFAFFALIIQIVFAYDFLVQDNSLILKFPLLIVLMASVMFFVELVWKFITGRRSFPRFTWLWEWVIYISYLVFILIFCFEIIKKL